VSWAKKYFETFFSLLQAWRKHLSVDHTTVNCTSEYLSESDITVLSVLTKSKMSSAKDLTLFYQ